MRRVISGFAVIAAATVVTQAIGFVALALVARKVGPSHLGAYNFAYAIAVYMTLPINFGIGMLGVREVAREPERTREIAAEIFSLQLAIALVCLGLIALLSNVLADGDAAALLPVAGLAQVFQLTAFDWTMQGLQRLGIVAIARLAGQILFGVLVIAFLTGGYTGVARYAWFNVAGLVVTALVMAFALARLHGTPALVLDTERLWRRLRFSVPLGVSVVLTQVYYSIDSVMLGYLKNDAAVGIYGVAYKIPLALTAFTLLWLQALYPHAAAMGDEETGRMRSQLGRVAAISIAVALPLGVGASLVATKTMGTMFGGDFTASGTPFALLTWWTAINGVKVNFASVLLARGEQRQIMIASAIGAVVNIGVNVYAIPHYGVKGAGVATITAESLVTLYLARRARLSLGGLDLEWGRVVRAAAATALMAGAVVLAEPLGVGLQVATGLVAFVALAAAFGVVRRDELRSAFARGAGT
jgi:O-antigen/teichoic acid export membrane protein